MLASEAMAIPEPSISARTRRDPENYGHVNSAGERYITHEPAFAPRVIAFFTSGRNDGSPTGRGCRAECPADRPGWLFNSPRLSAASNLVHSEP